MSILSLRLPESLHAKIRELAERDNISLNQFIATAVAEKAAALLTVSYLEARAQRADIKLLDRLLKRVPDVPAVAGDELPDKQPNKLRILAARDEKRKKSRKLSRRGKILG